MESEPKYDEYSYDSLIDVLSNIDADRFPERKAAAQAVLREKYPDGRPTESLRKIGKYQTFWRRLGAAFLDSIVIIIALGVCAWIILSIVGFKNTSALFAFNIAAALAVFAYSISMHAIYGQTLGKMAASVKVLNSMDESKIGLRQAFLRDSVPLTIEVVAGFVAVCAFLYGAEGKNASDMAMSVIEGTSTIWFITEVTTMLLNKKRRALHDFIAGTVVINVGNNVE